MTHNVEPLTINYFNHMNHHFWEMISTLFKLAGEDRVPGQVISDVDETLKEWKTTTDRVEEAINLANDMERELSVISDHFSVHGRFVEDRRREIESRLSGDGLRKTERDVLLGEVRSLLRISRAKKDFWAGRNGDVLNKLELVRSLKEELKKAVKQLPAQANKIKASLTELSKEVFEKGEGVTSDKVVELLTEIKDGIKKGGGPLKYVAVGEPEPGRPVDAKEVDLSGLFNVDLESNLSEIEVEEKKSEGVGGALDKLREMRKGK